MSTSATSEELSGIEKCLAEFETWHTGFMDKRQRALLRNKRAFRMQRNPQKSLILIRPSGSRYLGKRHHCPEYSRLSNLTDLEQELVEELELLKTKFPALRSYCVERSTPSDTTPKYTSPPPHYNLWLEGFEFCVQRNYPLLHAQRSPFGWNFTFEKYVSLEGESRNNSEEECVLYEHTNGDRSAQLRVFPTEKSAWFFLATPTELLDEVIKVETNRIPPYIIKTFSLPHSHLGTSALTLFLETITQKSLENVLSRYRRRTPPIFDLSVNSRRTSLY